MAGIVKSLDSALKANNLEKVASTMDMVGAGCCLRHLAHEACCPLQPLSLPLPLSKPALPSCRARLSPPSVPPRICASCLPALRPPACVPPLQFEKQFENLDVQSEFVEQAMQNQAVLSTPEDDVNLLVQQVGGCWVLGAGCWVLGGWMRVRCSGWLGWPANGASTLLHQRAE